MHRAGNRATETEEGTDKGQRYFVVIGGNIWYNLTAEIIRKKKLSRAKEE